MAAEIALTPLLRPTTSTGVVRLAVVPSPTAPVAFQPQHFTPPVSMRAQTWLKPATSAVTPLLRPTTSTGVVLLVVLPVPRAPKML